MVKWYEYLIGIGGVLVVGLGGYKAYADMKSNKEEEPISNEPFAAGNLDIVRERGSTQGSTGSFGVPSGSNPEATEVTYTPGELIIPLDSGEFRSRIDPTVNRVVLESPLSYVSDGGLVLDALQRLIVNRNIGGVATQQVVYVDANGVEYNSEQAILDAFVRQSATPELLAAIDRGEALSTLQAINAGQPINATNIITSRPSFFPEAKPDAISADFQSRARALQATLTVTNPGGSSAAGLPNFSRLAAVGTDLSMVDLYSVRNPDFLGEIKSGQGPLTPAQRILVDQARLAIDPRNQTSSDRAQISANLATRAAEAAATAARAKQLVAGGYNEANAKAALLAQGIRVTGSLSASQFAALEKRLGTTVTQTCLTCTSPTIQPTVSPTASNLSTCLNDKRKTFLLQTGRSDFAGLSQVETAVWNKLIAGCI